MVLRCCMPVCLTIMWLNTYTNANIFDVKNYVFLLSLLGANTNASIYMYMNPKIRGDRF